MPKMQNPQDRPLRRDDAHAYRLQQARKLLRDAGFVQRDDGSWEPSEDGQKA